MSARAVCFSLTTLTNIRRIRYCSFRVEAPFTSNRRPRSLVFGNFATILHLTRNRGISRIAYPHQTSRRTTSGKTTANMARKETKDGDMKAADVHAMLKKGGLIMKRLEEVYPEAPKGFLDHSDAFTLLIAVVLSAQSLDIKVNEITPELFRVGGTPEDMRELGETKIREIIKQIGLAPQKAKNIAKLSADIVDKFQGKVPDNFEDLESLAGVGHKTASVIMMQAFRKPAFPVDTHIHRLACRWGCGDAKSVVKTEQSLKKWFPDPETWGQLHTRIILFGREYCPARNHNMEECPICSFAATDEAWNNNRLFPKKFTAPASHKNQYSIRDVPPPEKGDEVLYTPPSKTKTTRKTKPKAVVARASTKIVEQVQVRKSGRRKTPVSYVEMEKGATEGPQTPGNEKKTSGQRGKGKRKKADEMVEEQGATAAEKAKPAKRSKRQPGGGKSTHEKDLSLDLTQDKRRKSSRIRQKNENE